MAAQSLQQHANRQPPARNSFRGQKFRETLTGYLFILPAVLIIGLFGFFPILYAVYMSTFNWRVRKGPFIGIDNYHRALGDWQYVLAFAAGFALLALAYVVWTRSLQSMDNRKLAGGVLGALALIGGFGVLAFGWGGMTQTGDMKFLKSLPITLYYALGAVPLQLAIGLFLASLLYQKIRGQSFFRMLYFLPYITPVVATAVVFRTIFSPRETSLANQFLSWFGLPPQKWLFEARPFLTAFFGLPAEGFTGGPSMALVSVILFGVWSFVGYNVVVFLAGLGGIPKEIYEAAEIDGASGAQMFRYVTIPMISSVTFYLGLVSFIGTLKAFNHLYVMRTPAALGSVDTASISIFDTFYKSNNYGYAAAQAIILFIIIAALTYAQNKLFAERVFYG